MRSNEFIFKNKKIISGFTLIETVIGMVVLTVSFTILTSFIFPLSNRSASQVHQIKAAELGQSMINEILGKAFDENSDMSGGLNRCGEQGVLCTSSLSLGSEEVLRELFDDVDDYHNLNTLTSSLGAGDSLADSYLGYSMAVQVINDSNYSGDSDGDNNFTAKLITVTVTTPQGENFIFSVYKMNF